VTEKDYAYCWKALQEAEHDKKDQLGDKCLEMAQSINQINDTLFSNSSANAEGVKENYWKAYIRLAENIRQLDRAFKSTTGVLREEARKRAEEMFPDKKLPLSSLK
jgi:hypothetical protein